LRREAAAGPRAAGRRGRDVLWDAGLARGGQALRPPARGRRAGAAHGPRRARAADVIGPRGLLRHRSLPRVPMGAGAPLERPPRPTTRVDRVRVAAVRAEETARRGPAGEEDMTREAAPAAPAAS